MSDGVFGKLWRGRCCCGGGSARRATVHALKEMRMRTGWLRWRERAERIEARLGRVELQIITQSERKLGVVREVA